MHCLCIDMSATLILPITLADLSPRTRDWLLAKSAALAVPPMQALNEVLEKVAAKELGGSRETQREGRMA